MKRILALRHAKAVERDEAETDAERVLTRRGRKDAEALGRVLASQGFVPAWILCSPAARARETAALVAHSAGVRREIAIAQPLYAGGAEECLAALAACPAEADTVLVVGHNPAMEELAGRIAGLPVPLKTCHLAVLEVAAAAWIDLATTGRGRLVAVLEP